MMLHVIAFCVDVTDVTCFYDIEKLKVGIMACQGITDHDDVIKWKHFQRYLPFVRGIHRSPVNSPHKGQWHGALMFSLICAWIDGRVNNREAGDLRRHHTHYDVSVMLYLYVFCILSLSISSVKIWYTLFITWEYWMFSLWESTFIIIMRLYDALPGYHRVISTRDNVP